MNVRRILCATDLTDTSLPAIREALSLARELGAMVTVLTVVPKGSSRRGAAPALIEQIDETVQPRGDCVAVHPVVREGTPGDEILAEATEEHADLLVLGTHGRDGYERLRLGSTAEWVIRRAPCPVITVRAVPRPATQPSATAA